MSGDESSTAFELRELQLLTQLRQHEADEARAAAEQACSRATTQRAALAQQALERTEAEHAEQEREWAAALAESQRAEQRLAAVARAERERAQAELSARRRECEDELARLARARSRPRWLLTFTTLLLATAAAMALATWRLHLTHEREQRALAELADQYEQDWQTALRRAEIAAGYAGRALAKIEFMEKCRAVLAKMRADAARHPPIFPMPPVSPPPRNHVPKRIQIPRECLENPLC